jgi:hypothetical protein
MTKARNISRFGDNKGVGSALGDTNKIFASVSTASTVTSNIVLDSPGPFIVAQEKELHIETGIGVTVEVNRTLIVNSMLIP